MIVMLVLEVEGWDNKEIYVRKERKERGEKSRTKKRKTSMRVGDTQRKQMD